MSVGRDQHATFAADGDTFVLYKREGADVAKAVRAIADGLLDYATGQIINIDGGFHLRSL